MPGCRSGNLVPALGRTRNGNAYTCTSVICAVCDGTGR